jgi:hypothetical protein
LIKEVTMQFPACRFGRQKAIWPIPNLGSLLLLLAISSSAHAARSCVHFDVPQLVACRPVNAAKTPPADSEQTVEATFDISTLLNFGQEGQVKQLLFMVVSPAGTLRVSDYSPKTALTSLYVGHIERSEQQEESGSVGVSASFAPSEFLSAEGNTSKAVKSSESVKFQSVPPLQLLAASGTAARGTAVYFKFRSTPQTTLDGSRQVRVQFRVPRSWRADYVYLRCAAYADAVDVSRGPVCGTSDFLVPLYLDGDDDARQAALDLAHSELELRQLARQLQPSVSRSRSASLSDRWTTLFREDKRRVPEFWLSTVLSSDPSQREFSFQEQLPDPLRHALTEFTETRWQLAKLNH